MTSSIDAGTPPKMSQRTQWIVLTGIVIVAALFRFAFIASTEAHYDELLNLELSTGRGSAHYTLPMNELIRESPAVTSLRDAPPWYAIFGSLKDDPHPPLRSMLLRLWRSLFGESIVSSRVLSALFSILCIPALFLTARQIHPPHTALWACLIMALASTQIVAAQEVRAYPLMVLLAICSAGVMLLIERKGATPRRCALLAFCLFLMLLTHYFAFPAAASLGIYALVRMRGRDRNAVLGSIVIAGAAFAILWGPMLLKQMPGFSAAAVPGAHGDPQATGHTINTLLRAAYVPLRLLFEPGSQSQSETMLGSVIFILPFILLRRRPELLLWAIWLPTVVGFVTIVDLALHARFLISIREVLLASPALYVLLAALLKGDKPLRRHGIPAVVCIACLGAIGLAYSRDNTPFSHLARYLQPAAGTGEPIVFYGDTEDIWWSQWMFLGTVHYSGTFPRAAVRLSRPASPELMAELAAWPSIWLVSAPTDVPLSQIIPGGTVLSSHVEQNVGYVAHVRLPAPATTPAVASEAP